MTCPYCGSEDSLVINKRGTNKNLKNWRRRRCTKCFKVFTTYESAKIDFIKIVKKDNRRVLYRREKLYSGIYFSCMHNKDADSGDASTLAEKVVNDIEYDLLKSRVKEISTEDLRFLVYKTIQKYDFSSALNYLSYFLEPKSFGELNRVQKKIVEDN